MNRTIRMPPSGRRIATKTTLQTTSSPMLKASSRCTREERIVQSSESRWVGMARLNSRSAIPTYLFSQEELVQPLMSQAARSPSGGFNNGGTTDQSSDLGEARPDRMAIRLCWHDPPTRRERRTCFSLAVNRRSEEHTSELQSLRHLVCRLL